jgi:metal-responsive CopG/Arc/MetJ family transcriptional regulator
MNYAQVVEICCRDLRHYLEYALTATRGGVVTVKMNRVMQVAPPPLDRKRYERCLGNVLRQWRWSTGVYVVPRRDAETLLSRFDESCASAARSQATAIRSQRPVEAAHRIDEADRPADREMTMISFHAPHAFVQALDKYAHRKNMTRSDVIRKALQQLIEKYRDVEADLHRPTALAAPPAAQEDELECTAFHETRYIVELLDSYAAALQVTRSDVIRAAIRQLIDRIRTAKEPEHVVI